MKGTKHPLVPMDAHVYSTVSKQDLFSSLWIPSALSVWTKTWHILLCMGWKCQLQGGDSGLLYKLLRVMLLLDWYPLWSTDQCYCFLKALYSVESLQLDERWHMKHSLKSKKRSAWTCKLTASWEVTRDLRAWRNQNNKSKAQLRPAEVTDSPEWFWK